MPTTYIGSGGPWGVGDTITIDNETITQTVVLDSNYVALMRCKVFLAGNGVDSYLVQSAFFTQDEHSVAVKVNGATTFYVPAYGRWSDYSSIVGFTVPGTINFVTTVKLKVPILIPIIGGGNNTQTGPSEPGVITDVIVESPIDTTENHPNLQLTTGSGYVVYVCGKSSATGIDTNFWLGKSPMLANGIYVGDYEEAIYAITDAGKLCVVGRDHNGEFGLGNYDFDISDWSQVGSDTDWAFVSPGEGHTLALKTDGTMWGSGLNVVGQLGLGNNYTSVLVFTKIGTDIWEYISAGWDFSVALKADGSLWGTGENHAGQLGLGEEVDRIDGFTLIGTGFKTVSAGQSGHQMGAVKTDGSLWMTGSSSGHYNSLGLGDVLGQTEYVYALTRVGDGYDWWQVWCSAYSSYAIKTDGTLWATGENDCGQLGLGDYEGRNVFTQAGTDTDWKWVSPGTHHCVALKTDGSVWTTGEGDYGKLGSGNEENINVFTRVGGFSDAFMVAAGYDHTAVLRSGTNNNTISVISTETITVTDNSLITAGDTITITGTSA